MRYGLIRLDSVLVSWLSSERLRLWKGAREMDKIIRVELLSDSDVPILNVTYVEQILFWSVQKTSKVYRHTYSEGRYSWRFLEDDSLTYQDDSLNAIYSNRLFSITI